MQIQADAGKCQGYGNCVDLDPGHFDLDDAGLVVVLKDSVAPVEQGTTAAAVRSCPVSAIWLVDSEA
jgi:ferredoxin